MVSPRRTSYDSDAVRLIWERLSGDGQAKSTRPTGSLRSWLGLRVTWCVMEDCVSMSSWRKSRRWIIGRWLFSFSALELFWMIRFIFLFRNMDMLLLTLVRRLFLRLAFCGINLSSMSAPGALLLVKRWSQVWIPCFFSPKGVSLLIYLQVKTTFQERTRMRLSRWRKASSIAVFRSGSEETSGVFQAWLLVTLLNMGSRLRLLSKRIWFALNAFVGLVELVFFGSGDFENWLSPTQ